MKKEKIPLPKVLDDLVSRFEQLEKIDHSNLEAISQEFFLSMSDSLIDANIPNRMLDERIRESFIPRYQALVEECNRIKAEDRQLRFGKITRIGKAILYTLPPLVATALFAPNLQDMRPTVETTLVGFSGLYISASAFIFGFIYPERKKLALNSRAQKEYTRGIYNIKRGFIDACKKEGIIDRLFQHKPKKHRIRNFFARNKWRLAIPAFLLALYGGIATAYLPNAIVKKKIDIVNYDSRRAFGIEFCPNLNKVKDEEAIDYLKAYLLKMPNDPFNRGNSYSYIEGEEAKIVAKLHGKDSEGVRGILYSFGPDKDDDKGRIVYDFKKGLKSNSDIIVSIIYHSEIEGRREYEK